MIRLWRYIDSYIITKKHIFLVKAPSYLQTHIRLHLLDLTFSRYSKSKIWRKKYSDTRRPFTASIRNMIPPGPWANRLAALISVEVDVKALQYTMARILYFSRTTPKLSAGMPRYTVVWTAGNLPKARMRYDRYGFNKVNFFASPSLRQSLSWLYKLSALPCSLFTPVVGIGIRRRTTESISGYAFALLHYES